MRDILLKRLKIISLPKAADGGGVATATDSKIRQSFLVELASIGYRVTNPEILNDVPTTDLLLERTNIIDTLVAMRGGDVEYVPLFQKFPEDIPDDNTYWMQRVIGFIADTMGLDGSAIFNEEEFGADPIHQMQVQHLYDAGVERQKKRKSDKRTSWIDIKIQFTNNAVDSVRDWMLASLYAKSSIKEALHADLKSLIVLFKDYIEIDKISQKENLALVLKFIWDDVSNEPHKLLRTPTDVLRLMAALTDSDISLAEAITFPKLGRAHRREVLTALENCSNLEEDLMRYKGLWLRMGEMLHPGEYAKRFPKTAEAFNKLRNDKIRTFNSRVQEALDSGNIKQARSLLVSRPGSYARRLHEILIRAQDEGNAAAMSVLDDYRKIAVKVPVKTLLTLLSYFSTINDLENRTIINKKGAIKIVENESKGKLNTTNVQALITITNEAIRDRLGHANLTKWGKTWIDPDLRNYVVPLQQRKGSDGLIAIPRGSKFSIPKSKVLRLFIYWKQRVARTDLDLSVVSYDKNWKCLGHVSYTRLSDGAGIVHSGDIQSAPNGAAEFIDIRYSALGKKVRYLAVQVNKYSGENFCDLEQAHAGWMARDRVSSDYKSFDIKTVENLLNIGGADRQALPLVVDVVERRALYVDLYKDAAEWTNVENTLSAVTTIIQEIDKFTDTRPNLYTLATLNAQARGEIVEDRKDADTTIGVSGCDFNSSDIEKILSEFIV
jgi:stress response protein SCP2